MGGAQIDLDDGLNADRPNDVPRPLKDGQKTVFAAYWLKKSINRSVLNTGLLKTFDLDRFCLGQFSKNELGSLKPRPRFTGPNFSVLNFFPKPKGRFV